MVGLPAIRFPTPRSKAGGNLESPPRSGDYKLNPNQTLMQPHRGTVILVLGILSLVICGPLGIVAWLLGSSDLKLMDAGQMDPTGRDLTQAGRVCGIIGTCILALSLLFTLGVFFVMILGGMAAALSGN